MTESSVKPKVEKEAHKSRNHLKSGALTQMSSSTALRFKLKEGKQPGSGDMNLSYSAAPGSYDLPVTIGKGTSTTNLKSPPNFTFGSKLEAKRYVCHELDKTYMTNSPGVGIYAPENAPVRSNSPKYSLTKERRVCPLGTYNFHTSHAPIQHGDISFAKERIKGIPRQTGIKLGKIRHITPGPGEYNSLEGMGKSAGSPRGTNPSFPKAKREYKFAEIGRSAGPCAYDGSLLKSKQTVPILKVFYDNKRQSERELSNVKSKVPGPTDYNVPEKEKYLGTSPRQAMPKAHRNTTRVISIKQYCNLYSDEQHRNLQESIN